MKLGKERVTAGWGRDGRREVDLRKLPDFVSLELQPGYDIGTGNGNKEGFQLLGKPRLRLGCLDIPDVPTDKRPYHKADIYKV